MGRQEELAALIDAQRADDKMHEVYAVSFDAFEEMDGWDVEYDDQGLLHEIRPPWRHKRVRGILAHRQRVDERRKLSGHFCIECGAHVLMADRRCMSCRRSHMKPCDGTSGCQCHACRKSKQGTPKVYELQRERTHCPRGHAYDDANTLWHFDRNRNSWGRGCRECSNTRRREKRLAVTRPSRTCSACAVAVDQYTDGCRTCWLRRKSRRARAKNRTPIAA